MRSHPAGSREQAPADLGPPVSYLVLKEGTPVYDPRGERVGVVDQIVADMVLDVFEGLVVHTEPLPGRHVFASAEQVAELHERGVLLSVGPDALGPVKRADSGGDQEAPADGRLHALLRRAVDRISGR